MAVPGRVRDYNNSTGETISTTRTSAGAAATLSSIATGDVSATDLQNAIAELAAEKVNKDLFDAGTFLYATSDNTPAAKTVAQTRALLKSAVSLYVTTTPVATVSTDETLDTLATYTLPAGQLAANGDRV